MTITTTSTTAYSLNEALAGQMTAKEWTERFEPEVLEITYDRDECIRQIAMHGDREAQRLNLPHSATGHYPPVIWEFVSLRNR